MGELIRIAFAIIIGILVYALLQWLATAIPHGVDVLLGIVAAFIAYASYPSIRGSRPL